MNEQQNCYPESADDERLHAQFTAYFITALRRSKARYLLGKYRDKKVVTSLDELLEHPESSGKPQLVTYPAELEQIFETGALEDILSNDRLLVAVLKLSDRERKILNLRIVHHMKHAEIASILGVRQNTVEQGYSRAIRKLRLYLEGGEENEWI